MENYNLFNSFNNFCRATNVNYSVSGMKTTLNQNAMAPTITWV